MHHRYGERGKYNAANDLRGFSWWGSAASFTTWVAPNSSQPDVTENSAYCVYPYQMNPPCTEPTSALRPVQRSPEPALRRSECHDGGRFGPLRQELGELERLAFPLDNQGARSSAVTRSKVESSWVSC